MKDLILFVIVFIVSYMLYYFFVLKRNNTLKKFKNGKEALYLKLRYKININEKNEKKIANLVYLGNSLILSLAVLVIGLFDNFIIGLIVSFLIILVLIIFIYHIIGTILKKVQERR